MQHGLYLPRAMKSHINAQCCYSLSSFTLYRYQNHSVQIHLFQYSSFTKDCKIDFQSVKLMANKSCTTRKGFHSVCWLLSSKIMNSVSWVRFLWLSLYSRLLLSKIVTYLPFFQMYTSVFQQDSVSTTFLWHRHHSTCHVFHQVRNDPCSSSPFFLSFTEFLTQFIFRCN